MEFWNKPVTKKKGHLDKQQQKLWNRHHETIKWWLIHHGFKSFRELSRILGIDKNTVKKHIKAFGENSFYVENGRTYLKTDMDYIMQSKTFPDEFKTLFKRINFPRMNRIGEENIGKVYFLFFPETLVPIYEPILFEIIDEWITEFSSSNPYWVKNILQVAVNHGYLSGEKPIEQISDVELDRVFQCLFGDKETALVVFALNVKELLAWLKTEKGKMELQRVAGKIQFPKWKLPERKTSRKGEQHEG